MKPFKADTCTHCLQTTQVLYALDAGTADIVKAVAIRIHIKGENSVHLTNEMMVANKDFSRHRMLAEGVLTYSMRNNTIKAHKHGLLAKIRGKEGYWCLTSKGARFLKGERVPKYAIRSKVTKHIEGYYLAETENITIQELQHSTELYWVHTAFDIVDGRYMPREQAPQAQLL